jgi:hypothetical protein
MTDNQPDRNGEAFAPDCRMSLHPQTAALIRAEVRVTIADDVTALMAALAMAREEIAHLSEAFGRVSQSFEARFMALGTRQDETVSLIGSTHALINPLLVALADGLDTHALRLRAIEAYLAALSGAGRVETRTVYHG